MAQLKIQPKGSKLPSAGDICRVWGFGFWVVISIKAVRAQWASFMKSPRVM